MTRVYRWDRLWQPLNPNHTIPVIPESTFFYRTNWKEHQSQYVHLSQLDMIPCLHLFGDGGLGKSTTIKQEDDRLRATGVSSIYQDLRMYHNRFWNQLENIPIFRQWLSGNGHLTLFLDALDEGLKYDSQLHYILFDKFESLPISRLFFRVVCQPSRWQTSWSEDYIRLWGQSAIKKYELMPLRQEDIILAANECSLNSSGFINEIHRKRVLPLASRPITLNFLITQYQHDRELSKSQDQLYEDGCRWLCSERSTKPTHYMAGEKLAVASRIAAVMIFGNYSHIYRPTMDIPSDTRSSISVDEFWNKDVDRIDQIQWDKNLIEETLETPLFTKTGYGYIWSHQSYPEFLAAQYANKYLTSNINQLISILFSSTHSVIPQLQSTTIWLATMNKSILEHILLVNPELVLYSDLSRYSDDDRSHIVKTFLQSYGEQKLHRVPFGPIDYQQLMHANLEVQLRSFIQDGSVREVGRCVALDIAAACRIHNLQDIVVTILVDGIQALRIRQHAARALQSFDLSPTSITAIKQILPIERDPDILVMTLELLWPENIATEELLNYLPMPHRDSLYHDPFSHIAWMLSAYDFSRNDFIPALQWVQRQGARQRLSIAQRELMNTIMRLGWERFDDEQMVGPFVEAVISRLAHYEQIVVPHNIPGVFSSRRLPSDVFQQSERNRQRLITALINRRDEWPVQLSLALLPITKSDIPWLINRLETEVAAVQEILISLIIQHYRPEDDTISEVIWQKKEHHVGFKWLYNRLYAAIDLNSPLAVARRRDAQELRAAQAKVQTIPHSLTFEKLLQNDTESQAIMWEVMERVSYPGGLTQSQQDQENISVLQTLHLDSVARQQVIQIAHRYLIHAAPTSWGPVNSRYTTTYAGYRALHFLWVYAPSLVEGLEDTVWTRWADQILVVSQPFADEDQRSHRQMIQLFYHRVPRCILDKLSQYLIDPTSLFLLDMLLDRIEYIWNDAIAFIFLNHVQENCNHINLKGYAKILGMLIDHDITGIRTFIDSLIQLSDSMEDIAYQNAVTAAYVLMSHAKDAGWSTLWPLLRVNKKFGHDVLGKAVSVLEAHHLTITRKLSSVQLKDLYIWLVHEFPFDEDNRKGGAITAHDCIRWWRDGILTYLQGKGEYQLIDTISEYYPSIDFLAQNALQARANYAEQTWQPLQSRELFALVCNRNTRLVRNGDELLTVVLESLERLQQSLRDETPMVIFLWNKAKGKNNEVDRFWPKEEEELSDWIKKHLEYDLRDRGIIPQREVQIRRKLGKQLAPGQDTDILVSTVHESDRTRISVIIEVKGCWNGEVKTAMRKQLHDRYLYENSCQYGIYIVGWFTCTLWDKEDYRRDQTPKMSLNEARTLFDTQAKELSHNGTAIKSFVLDATLPENINPDTTNL